MSGGTDPSGGGPGSNKVREMGVDIETEVGLVESSRWPVADKVSHWREYAPTRAFASAPDARRQRRPTDVLLLLFTFTLFFIMTATAEHKGILEQALVQTLDALPDVLMPLWKAFHDILLIWAAWIVLLALFRRHWGLVRDIVLGVVLTVIGAAIAGRIAEGSWPDLVGGLFQTGRTIDYPSLGLAANVAIASIASPHLARPFRYVGRWLVVLGGIASVALMLALPGQTLGALALGWTAAAVVHLIFGSPGGIPSLDRIRDGLKGLGVEAEPLGVEPRNGVAWVDAQTPDGRMLDVKVYGRDAWDGQLLVAVWRFIWYRDTGPTLSLSRLQQVEHEAFITLLAERRGAPVPRVLSAGIDLAGDALLVTERFGEPLSAVATPITDAQLASAWAAMRRLHDAGISHGGITLDRIRVEGDEVRLSDFAAAEVAPADAEFPVDRAQLLVATALRAGTERAVAAAHAALGHDRLVELTSYVQPAALPVPLRRDADAAGLDVDDVRKAVAEAAETPPQDLQQLRRLTWGKVFLAALLAIASYILISSIVDIGLDVILQSMRDASFPLLVLAFLIGLTPRFANAVALSAASPIHVPLGRLSALQLAIAFVNVAMPSTAARVAVNVRFFQRQGVQATEAMTIGVADSFVGFLGQISLILVILGLDLGSIDINLTDKLGTQTVTRLLILLAIAIVVAVLVVVLVERLRTIVVSTWHRVIQLLGPLLRSPRRILTLFFANVAGELLFSLCMYTTLHAFGQPVSFVDMVLINELVALFAGLMPVPGGVGVTEAALTAGFVAIGVPEEIAFAAAITQRVVTYYTQPIVGWFAFRWLQRQRFL